MLTKEEATNPRLYHLHYTGGRTGSCAVILGPKGGYEWRSVECKINGKVKTWKRSPNRFSIPVKYGLYEYTYATEENAPDWHTPASCAAQEYLYKVSRMTNTERIAEYARFTENPAEKPDFVILK